MFVLQARLHCLEEQCESLKHQLDVANEKVSCVKLTSNTFYHMMFLLITENASRKFPVVIPGVRIDCDVI